MRRSAAGGANEDPEADNKYGSKSHAEWSSGSWTLNRILLVIAGAVFLFMTAFAPIEGPASEARNDAPTAALDNEHLKQFIKFESLKEVSETAQRARDLEESDPATAAAAAVEGKAALQPRFFATTSEKTRSIIEGRYEAARAKSLIVLTSGNSVYQEWQKRCCVYTMKQTNPDFQMVTLTAHVLPLKDPLAVPVNCSLPYMGCPVVETEDVQSTLLPGDTFIVYNRAWSILKFFERFTAEQAEGKHAGITNIILMEPDMFMVRPATTVAAKGSPIGHKYFYMDGSTKYAKGLLAQCTKYPEYYSPIGLPMIFHIDDLMAVLPLWIEKTIAVRREPWGLDEQGKPNWLGDMWGLCCALCDLKMRAIPMPVAPEPPMDPDMEDDPDSFALHYTFNTRIGTYYFEKREWWKQTPEPRPFGPIRHDLDASKLQLLFADTFDEAIVAAYGPTPKKP